MSDGDHHVPPVRMDQSMSIAAVMVGALIGTFKRETDSEDDLWKLHMACLATFLYQLLIVAKHKRELISILYAIIEELEAAIANDAVRDTPEPQAHVSPDQNKNEPHDSLSQ